MTFYEFQTGDTTTVPTNLNGNFKSTSTRRNSSAEDTTEYDVALNGSWTDMGYTKTFTCPETTNNILTGFRVQLDSKTASDTSADGYPGFFMRIKVTNDTSSTSTYLYNTVSTRRDAANNRDYATLTAHGVHSGTTYTSKDMYFHPINTITTNSFDDISVNAVNGFNVLQGGSTYTITIECISREYAAVPTDTMYIDNTTVTIYWSYLDSDDVSGWA